MSMSDVPVITVNLWKSEEYGFGYEVEVLYDGIVHESWLCSDMKAVRSVVEEYFCE